MLRHIPDTRISTKISLERYTGGMGWRRRLFQYLELL
jgi:hypothetical protein